MKYKRPYYIYQHKDWPGFHWEDDRLIHLLGKVRNLQGKVIGKMDTLGFDLKSEANMETLIQDVLKSSEIEGELLNPEQVRSSLAMRLGIEISGLKPADRHVDGVVEMMLDATQKYNKTLSKNRLQGWHAALFPTGRSGLYKIAVGKWRDDGAGSMQVVSGPLGKEKVHFQAPAATVLEKEMAGFLHWLNKNTAIDPVLKAGLAHLWFVTIHPFADGNGRIARAIADMLLARADGITQRFYSMSSQIRKERKAYYNILEETQKGGLDITDWLEWFLNCLLNALEDSAHLTEKVIKKHQFWNKNSSRIGNPRQRLLLGRLLDGFEGKLTSSKWAKIAKCSADTALRDINDLIEKGILIKAEGGGRSTGYELIEYNPLE